MRLIACFALVGAVAAVSFNLSYLQTFVQPAGICCCHTAHVLWVRVGGTRRV